MDKVKAHKKMLKMWDEVHLLNGLLRKMEKERLHILYYNVYHKDYEKKRTHLQNIDQRIQRAIDKRIELCNKTLDLLSGGCLEEAVEEAVEGAGHGKT